VFFSFPLVPKGLPLRLLFFLLPPVFVLWLLFAGRVLFGVFGAGPFLNSLWPGPRFFAVPFFFCSRISCAKSHLVASSCHFGFSVFWSFAQGLCFFLWSEPGVGRSFLRSSFGGSLFRPAARCPFPLYLGSVPCTFLYGVFDSLRTVYFDKMLHPPPPTFPSFFPFLSLFVFLLIFLLIRSFGGALFVSPTVVAPFFSSDDCEVVPPYLVFTTWRPGLLFSTFPSGSRATSSGLSPFPPPKTGFSRALL